MEKSIFELTELKHEKTIEVDKDGTAHIQRSYIIKNRSGVALTLTKERPYPLTLREETLQVSNVSFTDQTGKPLHRDKGQAYGGALLQGWIDDKTLGTDEEYKVTFGYDYQGFATSTERLWAILEPYSLREGAREGEQYSVKYCLPPLETKSRFWEKLLVVATLDGVKKEPELEGNRRTVSWTFVLTPGGVAKRVQITYVLETRTRLLSIVSGAISIIGTIIIETLLRALLRT